MINQGAVKRTQSGTANKEKPSALCLGMGNCAASILMGLFYLIAPILYVWKYTWIANFGWIIWSVLSILTGVFFYAAFLCAINAFIPSAIYCKQLEFIQHKLWLVLAVVGGVCLLLSISQFVAVKYKKTSFNFDTYFDGVVQKVYESYMHPLMMKELKLNEDDEAIKALDKWVVEFKKSEYTAAYCLLGFAVILSLFAISIWAIESQFAEMAAHIYEEKENDFLRAELFAAKMRKPDSPKFCFCFGNMVASLFMVLIYLLPLIVYCCAYKYTPMKLIVDGITKNIPYFNYIFYGFLIIQVVVFLYAAILSLINAINPSMWCCAQIRNISTYLIILVSIFSCISVGLAIHQLQKNDKYIFTRAEEIEKYIDDNMEKVQKFTLDVERKYLENKSAAEELKNFDADYKNKIEKIKENLKKDTNTARNFFAVAGLVGVIFIVGLKYMESQFQAMCVFLYGYDIYAQNKEVEDALDGYITGP